MRTKVKLTINIIIRQKVDLTKYIEEHNYIFDAVYDENSTND